MNAFKSYHPIVNFVYFVSVIALSCYIMHPLCLGISLMTGFVYSIILNGKKAVRFNLLYMLPLLCVATLINPAFNHEGTTIICYLPSGNPLTWESVIYGAAAALMIASVICWFSCYNSVMTSDKFIYLFGRIMPSMSLILSMTLRFIPRFKAQIKTVANAQKCIGRDMSSGGVISRAKNGITILSIMITWALENAIDTADSMKSRGYGLSGRTAFSIFTFDKRDIKATAAICIFGLYVIVGIFKKAIWFRYFPSIKALPYSAYSVSVFAAYLILCLIPIITELTEELQWKATQSKI